MHFPTNRALTLLLAASASVSFAAEEKPSTTPSPPACTAVSKTSGAFFDLRPDIAAIPEEGKTAKSGSATSDYHARGYDYGRNFTLNICAPVADPVEHVVGLGKDEWKNVSAYYTYKDEVYSIGQTSLDLQSHGRMLVLQYTGGSPCGADKPKENNKTKREDSHDSYKGFGGEKLAEATDSDDEKKNKPVRRKSATLSFHCEPEQLAGQIGVSFVSTDPEECAYFFEIRSAHACARAEPHQPGSVGPGSVFAIIFAIAVLVYFGGGVFYNRTVEHARGWRQLPNYTLWAGIWNFICDVFYAALSLCARLLPGRRGYSHLAGSPSRSRNREDENRLIDQLDEEWDD
ncbi:putative mannose 6-phosphate receptor-like protein like [Verticillium longisporum]|nr:putative mannose 6-phosphate receptor-like protein like [Verticillium longisporum]